MRNSKIALHKGTLNYTVRLRALSRRRMMDDGQTTTNSNRLPSTVRGHCSPMQLQRFLHMLICPVPVVPGALQYRVEAVFNVALGHDAHNVLRAEVVGLPRLG